MTSGLAPGRNPKAGGGGRRGRMRSARRRPPRRRPRRGRRGDGGRIPAVRTPAAKRPARRSAAGAGPGGPRLPGRSDRRQHPWNRGRRTALCRSRARGARPAPRRPPGPGAVGERDQAESADRIQKGPARTTRAGATYGHAARPPPRPAPAEDAPDRARAPARTRTGYAAPRRRGPGAPRPPGPGPGTSSLRDRARTPAAVPGAPGRRGAGAALRPPAPDTGSRHRRRRRVRPHRPGRSAGTSRAAPTTRRRRTMRNARSTPYDRWRTGPVHEPPAGGLGHSGAVPSRKRHGTERADDSGAAGPRRDSPGSPANGSPGNARGRPRAPWNRAARPWGGGQPLFPSLPPLPLLSLPPPPAGMLS